MIDGLLKMRKAETVAHGATGTTEELAEVLERRLPQLQALLIACEPIWQTSRLVVPLKAPDEPTAHQRAWSFVGPPPTRSR